MSRRIRELNDELMRLTPEGGIPFRS
jgi:hypothetical protein